jgi:hypothetical protein
MDRGVHLHQLPKAFPSGAATAVAIAALPWLPQPLVDEPTTEGFHTDLETAFGEFFAGQGGAKVVEVAAILLENATAEVGLVSAIGGAAAKTMDDSFIAFGLESPQEASHMPWGKAEESRGFGLRTFPLQNRR